MELQLTELITHAGLWAIFATIFVESGLLVGFFLPGDTLLFAAGLYASLPGGFNIFYLIIGGIISAILGYSLGYHIGHRYGPRFFNKEESWLFHKDHVKKAEEFYKKYGPLTIIIARFVPVIRVFVPVLAGVGKMSYATFTLYNILSAILWVTSISFLAYSIGWRYPNLEKYILPVVLIVTVASVIAPIFLGMARKLLKSKNG